MLSYKLGIGSVVIDAKNAKCHGSCCRKFKDVLVKTIAGRFDCLSPPSPSSTRTSFITSPLSRTDKISAASSRELVAHNIKFINLTAEETIWAHQYDKNRKRLVTGATFAYHRRIGLKEGLPEVGRWRSFERKHSTDQNTQHLRKHVRNVSRKHLQVHHLHISKNRPEVNYIVLHSFSQFLSGGFFLTRCFRNED